MTLYRITRFGMDEEGSCVETVEADRLDYQGEHLVFWGSARGADGVTRDEPFLCFHTSEVAEVRRTTRTSEAVKAMADSYQKLSQGFLIPSWGPSAPEEKEVRHAGVEGWESPPPTAPQMAPVEGEAVVLHGGMCPCSDCALKDSLPYSDKPIGEQSEQPDGVGGDCL